MSDKIGVIQEVGDMSPWNELNEKDQKVVQESSKKEDNKKH